MHRKPEEDRKEDTIRLRVTAEQRRRLEQAAHRAGLELSAWLRTVGLKAARRELG